MSLSDTTKLAAVYARVSTRDQSDKGFSLPTQHEACLRYATELGYTVPIAYSLSEDYTGTSLRRPQLSVLRDLVRQRQIQAVIVHDMDRLSRKLAHQLLLDEEFEHAGVTLYVVTMPANDKSPEGQLLANVKGIIAEYERAKILERTARGRQGRAKAGHVPYGRRTYGYLYVRDPVGAHYEEHPDEASMVQRIFRMYTDGLSMTAIAAQLTAEGIPTPKDVHRSIGTRVWHHSTVNTILANETYIGVMYDGKTRNLPGKSNPDRKTRHEKLPREHWIAVEVPAIIDAATWQAAQALRQQNRIYSRRSRKYDYLLIHGRLRCGQCGSVMSGECTPTGKARYRCTRAKRKYLDVIAAHTQRSVMADQIEPVVWQSVERVLREPDIIARELVRQQTTAASQHHALSRERAHYQRQLARCEKESVKTWDAYVNDALSLERFKAIEAELTTKREHITHELAKLDETEQVLLQTAATLTTLREYCAKVHSKLHRFSTEEKQLVCDALDLRVVWNPGQPPAMTGVIPLGTEDSSSG